MCEVLVYRYVLEVYYVVALLSFDILWKSFKKKSEDQKHDEQDIHFGQR